jgi:hypothetical protein
MASMDIPPVNTDTVETLLRGRLPLPREVNCDEMARVAEILAGFATPKRFEEVSAHLSACHRCRDAVMMLCAIDETADSTLSAVVLPKKRTRSTPWHGSLQKTAWAVAASLLLVMGLYFFAFYPSDAIKPSGEDMLIKGTPDSFFVGVSRGPHRFSAEPFDKLEENDSLGMFYTAKEDGFLMVINMDNSRNVSLLYPVGQTESGAIRAGKEVSLSDGALVQAGSGCEWVVAAFSDAPIQLKEMTRVLKGAAVSKRPCDLKVSVPAARTVRVLPFRR